MIYLENLNFVQVHGDIYISLNKLKFSIAEKGIEAIKSLTSESIRMYLDIISYIIENYPYKTTSEKFKFLLYEGDF